jgi:hypothetical protein
MQEYKLRLEWLSFGFSTIKELGWLDKLYSLKFIEKYTRQVCDQSRAHRVDPTVNPRDEAIDVHHLVCCRGNVFKLDSLPAVQNKGIFEGVV